MTHLRLLSFSSLRRLLHPARFAACLLPVVVLLCAGCASRPVVSLPELLTEGTTRARNLLSVREQRAFDGIYLEALRQKYKDAPDAAFDLLDRALEINPNDAEALFQQSMLVLNSDVMPDSALQERATQQLLRATQLEPSNEFYLRTLAAHWIERGKWVRAARLYEMITAHSEKADDLAALISIYDHAGDPQSALVTLDRYERIGERDQSTVSQRAKYLVALGRNEQAYEVLREFCAENPDNPNYRLELADLFVRTGRPDEGYNIIQNVLDAHPGHGGALISLLAYYEAKHDRAQFERQFSLVMRSPEVLPRQKVAIFESMARAVDAGDYDKYRLYRHGLEAISLPGGSSPMPEVLSDFVRAAKLPEDSLAAPARALLAADSTNAEARRHALRAAIVGERTQEADALCAAGRRLHPADLTFYYFGGLSQQSQHRPDEAIALYRAAIPHITAESDSSIVSLLYAALGDALHDNKQSQQAYEAYDTALTYDPNNVDCLNNYAYFLAVAGRRLPDAVRMAARAVEISPSEVSYIDTYAWALYRSHNYKAARTQIDLLLQLLSDADANRAQDANAAGYYDRAGDIYAALGLRKEALRFWKHALQHTDDNALSKRLRTKIKRGRP